LPRACGVGAPRAAWIIRGHKTIKYVDQAEWAGRDIQYAIFR